MNIINQVYYSAKRILADARPIMTRLLSFVVIILILGSAFGKAFDASSLEKVKILYYSDDSGSGERFAGSMAKVEGIKAIADFERASSVEKAKQTISSGKADALVYIKNKTVEVYCKKNSGVNATVVQNIVDSFVNVMNTAWAVYRMTGSLEGFTFSSSDSLREEPISHTKPATAMGYYAVAMLLMLLLNGMDYGRVGIGEDYLGILGDRIRLSPIKPFEQYLGKIAGLSLVTFLQGVAIVLFTRFVYGVDWGNNFTLIIFIVFTFSVLTTTLGAMLSIVTRDVMKAGSIVPVAILVFTFLAGGFVVADFGSLAKLSPSYYAKTAIFNVVYDGNLNYAYINIGLMWAITLIFAIISIGAARRKRA